jgi:glucosamine kinase
MSTKSDRALIIGVDGGQSSTRTLLATIEGEILGGCRTGPANHIDEPGGLERQYRALHEGYLGAFEAAGLEPRTVACAYLGLTGSGHLETARGAVPGHELVMKNDVVTAFAGALPDLYGVVVVAGTGSIAYGRDGQGREHRTGGWGYFAGDEGSSYDVARNAFRAIYQASDGRSSPTLLTELLLSEYGCRDLVELRRLIYSSELGRDRLAAAARLVGQAAAAGDDAASRILHRAAGDLGQLVTTILAALDFRDQPVPVSPVGGLFGGGEPILTPLLEQIREKGASVYLNEPRFSPAKGALVLALEKLGRPASEEEFRNLESNDFPWRDRWSGDAPPDAVGARPGNSLQQHEQHQNEERTDEQ